MNEQINTAKKQLKNLFNTDRIKPVSVKEQIASAKKIQPEAMNWQQDIIAILKENNRLVQQLIRRTTLDDLNDLSSNFVTLTIAATATATQAYVAQKNQVVILAHPAGVAGEGAGILFIGNSGVNTTTGFPIISGESYKFRLKRNAEIWVVSDTTASLHILLF